MKKRTPAQEQYYLLKQAHKDCLLFFRLGDFYELFYEDAHTAHKVLGITLTAKNKTSDAPIPMAGVPFHAADKYIPQLIDAGYKVAIAEQVGQVIPGKVVERQVVHIVTPGTYATEKSDALVTMAVYSDEKERFHCARGDFTTGQYKTKTFLSLEDLVVHASGQRAAEIIISLDFSKREEFIKEVDVLHGDVIWSYSDYPVDVESYITLMTGTKTIDGYGSAVEDGREYALAVLFSYLESTQKQSLQGVHTITHDRESLHIRLDPITVKNLELVESSYEGSKKHSLLGVLDRCKTSMGSRLLKERLLHPHGSIDMIVKRQGEITKWQSRGSSRCEKIDMFLKDCLDIPRLLTRIFYKDPDPLVIAALRDTLGDVFSHKDISGALLEFGLSKQSVVSLQEISYRLHEQLVVSEYITQKRSIKAGYDKEVDKLRHLVENGDQSIVEYFSEIKPKIGVSSCKIKFVNNQGYIIEVSKKDAQAIESASDQEDAKMSFYRRQSLKSAERYSTPYLDDLQKDYFSAKELLLAREAEILQDIKQSLIQEASLLHGLSDAIASLDCVSLMDFHMNQWGWVLPSVSEVGALEIKNGRHSVVEYYLEKNSEFIPNDCFLDDSAFFQLITGPNMGGKSTYLRQNALIVLMAHCGFPVPVKEAKIPLVDAIFARVGSGDALAKNQSTFMTEMVEMAVIVNNATKNSFVILDELGRGTSTYDGLSLAKSLCVYMCQEVGAKTLFATHYHELVSLEKELQGFHNSSVGVYETGDKVIFLKKIVPGGASKSYGLDVAGLAGIPKSIIDQAEIYLKELDDGSVKTYVQSGLDFSVADSSSDLISELKELLPEKIEHITPLEAMNFLQKIMEKLG